ncbi:MAG: 3-deoxy-D-arabino-heptulosonate 7-phosphate synthase, partial [Deltaproteobacteria bacterium]|nr:3-deoxy-D-arabino-heptulosonate 7-phosphate synthase [Nannocystaceae bacterium]
MIIEFENGRQSTIDQIRDLAARFGLTIEITHRSGVYSTVHVLGDTREFAGREGYLRDLPGVHATWRVTSEFKNIAAVVSGSDGAALRRSRRVVEVPG